MAGHGHTPLYCVIERSLPDWVRQRPSVPVIVVQSQRKTA
jgi:hypothetical protein